MNINNLELFNLAETPHYKAKRYAKNGRVLYGEKAIHDCKKLAKKTKQILGRSLTNAQVSRLLSRIGKQVKIGLKIEREKDIKDGPGNIEGKGGFNSLAEEVRRLVLDGKTLRGRSHRLCQKYHLPSKCIKDEWDRAHEYLRTLSVRETEALRVWDSLPIMSAYEKRKWDNAAKAQRKKMGLKWNWRKAKAKIAPSLRDISRRRYKKRFGHSLDSDGKEFEKSGYKRIRPGAGVFIFSGPSPSRASSVPRKAKEKIVEVQPQR